MDPSLTSLGLKYFPRHKTPGVIPYVPLEEYGRQNLDPVVLWESTTYTINLSQLKKLVSPLLLDTFFVYIQNCADKNIYPRGVQTRYRKWFKDIFPHSRRDGHVYVYTSDLELYSTQYRQVCDENWLRHYNKHLRERALIRVLSRGELSYSNKHKKNSFDEDLEKELLKYNLTEEQKQEITPDGALPCFKYYESSPYRLYVPNLELNLVGANYEKYAVPPLSIWRLILEDMMKTESNNLTFSEMRDFCYKMDCILDDTSSSIQRDYLKTWVESRFRRLTD